MAAVVIGCGVSGLSVGIRLLEAGIPTKIWTREPATETASHVAAAFWYPYKVFPENLVLGWAGTTYTELSRLASVPGSGVIVRECVEVLPEPTPDPWWSELIPSFRHLTSAELPDGYPDGYFFYCLVAQMPLYLSYLQQRFQALGGQVCVRSVNSIDDATKQHSIVVNCAGLGARELIGDKEMTPIRGQVVRVSQVGLERIFLDQYSADGLTYIVPRSTDCVLGGTAESSEDLRPDETTAAQILARCIQREPRLREAAVLESQVGLRPGRPGVRVEIDNSISNAAASHTVLVHNYGHGGAGVTLSWGCADQVTELVRTAVGG